MYTTVADVSRLWRALFAGTIVSAGWVAELVRPRSHVPEDAMWYGLGFGLPESSEQVLLVGMDAGVSFLTSHDRQRGRTWTIISNTADGVWPLARRIGVLPA